MEGNAKRKRVTIRSIINRAAFAKGFSDYHRGKPFDYRAFEDDQKAQWDYERGRLLATVYKGPLKDGRYVLQQAVWAFKEARAANVLI